MKILSLECSAAPASVAISEDGMLLAESYVNVRLTHSETLMPMVENALSAAKLSIGDIDGFAIAVGPGSFTGVRIGVSALKGMAWASDKPCAGVSTLEGMANVLPLFRGLIVCAMDARCSQVYNALFYSDGESLKRLCEDRAVFAADLAKELETLEQKYSDEPILFIGDGAEIAFNAAGNLKNRRLPPEHLRYQRAAGIAAVAAGKFQRGETVVAQDIMPVYLRLPQAERELKAKKEKQKKEKVK